jgi:hypothetical protein
MTDAKMLLGLEQQTWEALSGANPVGAFAPFLASEVVMLFPGDLMLHGKAACLEPLAGVPAWTDFAIDKPCVVGLTGESGVIAYRVTARRPDQDEYTALVSSCWVRRNGRWQLTCHQQTPT